MMCRVETISLSFLALLFALHFIADFLLQPREMGKKKSTHPGYLGAHVAINFLVFFVGLTAVRDVRYAASFAFLNAAVHGIIDGLIWNFYKWFVFRRQINNFHPDVLKATRPWKRRSMIAARWEYWNDHWFYVTIGLDQLLHALTIILTLWILK